MSILSCMYIASGIIILVGSILHIRRRRRSNQLCKYYIVDGIKYTASGHRDAELHSNEYSGIEKGDTRVILNSLCYASSVKRVNILGLKSIFWSLYVENKDKYSSKHKSFIDSFNRKLEDI